MSRYTLVRYLEQVITRVRTNEMIFQRLSSMTPPPKFSEIVIFVSK